MKNSPTTYEINRHGFTPLSITLTTAEKRLFCDYYTDRGNWSDQPLVGGNVSQGPAENALLTNLKRKDLLSTHDEEGNTWISFSVLAEPMYQAICKAVAGNALNNVAEALEGTEIELEAAPTTDLDMAMKCIEAQRKEIDELKSTPEAKELRQLKSDRETLVYETKAYDRQVTALKARIDELEATVRTTERMLKHVRADRRDLTEAVKNADKMVLDGAIALGCLATEIELRDARDLERVAEIDELTQTIERMLKSKAVAGLKASGGAVVLPSEAAPRPGIDEPMIVSRVPKAHTKLGPGGDFTRELND